MAYGLYVIIHINLYTKTNIIQILSFQFNQILTYINQKRKINSMILTITIILFSINNYSSNFNLNSKELEPFPLNNYKQLIKITSTSRNTIFKRDKKT